MPFPELLPPLAPWPEAVEVEVVPRPLVSELCFWISPSFFSFESVEPDAVEEDEGCADEAVVDSDFADGVGVPEDG